MKNIVFPILRNAETNRDKAAIVDCSGNIDRHITYSALAGDVEAFAGELKRQGCCRGDRIIVFVPMSYQTYVAVLAVFYIGAVAVFIDAWVDAQRLNDSIAITSPVAIISNKPGRASGIPDGIRQIYFNMECLNGCKRNTLQISPEYMGDEDEAIFTFTTGSTGIPKAARRTHRFFLTQHQILSKYLGHKSDEINMVTFPVFLLSNLLSGITSVIPSFNPAEPSNVDCSWIAGSTGLFNVNSITGSTALFEKLSSYIMSGGEKVMLEKIVIGGSPVFPSIAERLCEAFGDTDIRIIYGATEAVPISMDSARNISWADAARGLPVGKVIPEIELKIIKPYDRPVILDSQNGLEPCTVPEGEVGEIIVAGPHVLKEYVNNPEANRLNKISDGKRLWHRTGDAGSIDSHGNLRFFGRVKNRFYIKGESFYPLPVENQLLGAEGVEFAAVVESEGKITAVLELFKEQKIHPGKILQNIGRLGIGFIDDFIIMDKIPRDPRHNSKANYEELKKHIVCVKDNCPAGIKFCNTEKGQ